MEGDFILHMIHILGDQIIECDVDALSRGFLTERVMRGEPILYFLHLYLSVE